MLGYPGRPRIPRYALLYSISDTAVAGILDGAGIFAQCTAQDQTRFGQLASRLAGLPGLAALSNLSTGDLKVKKTLHRVDGDHVTILNESNGTTGGSLRNDMAYCSC